MSRRKNKMTPGRIRALRTACGLTRTEFAVVCGVEAERVKSWEEGGRVTGIEHTLLLVYESDARPVVYGAEIFARRVAHKLGFVPEGWELTPPDDSAPGEPSSPGPSQENDG